MFGLAVCLGECTAMIGWSHVESIIFISFTGEFRLVDLRSEEFAEVSEKFSNSWVEGTPPSIRFVFAVTNPTLKQKWSKYRKTLISKCRSVEKYYHMEPHWLVTS